jgi:hypothetical protein
VIGVRVYQAQDRLISPNLNIGQRPRLSEHSREGWQTLAIVNALGKVAAAIEDSILKWWRTDLQLPPCLGPDEMPQKGWTETVALAEINVAETIRRMRSMASA